MIHIKKLVFLALMSAVSIIIFVLEAQIPPVVPIPGVKLGLANIISLSVLLSCGPVDALLVLVLRCILGSLLSGQLSALPYSLVGGLFALAAMVCFRRIIQENQLFILSVIGAVFHNIGQILTAAVITETAGLFLYLPILLVSGIATGLFTGITVQYFLPKLRKAKRDTYVS